MTRKAKQPAQAGKAPKPRLGTKANADPAKEAKRATNRAKRDAIAKDEDQKNALVAVPTPETMARDRRCYALSDADSIIALIAEGRSMRQACEAVGVARSTFLTWAMDDVDGLAARYARAREIGIHVMVDEVTDIVDDGRNDWLEVETKAGRTITVANHEHIARSKLRADHRKWIASKVLPALYGEKVEVNHKVAVQELSEDALDAAIARVMDELGGQGPVSGTAHGKGAPARPQ